VLRVWLRRTGLGSVVVAGAFVAFGLLPHAANAQTFQCSVDGGASGSGLHQCFNFTTNGIGTGPGGVVEEFYDCGAGYIIQEHGHGSRGAPFQVLSHVFEADGQITRSRFQDVGSTYGVVWLTGECRTREP
jgi:hypothetical protein